MEVQCRHCRSYRRAGSLDKQTAIPRNDADLKQISREAMLAVVQWLTIARKLSRRHLRLYSRYHDWTEVMKKTPKSRWRGKITIICGEDRLSSNGCPSAKCPLPSAAPRKAYEFEYSISGHCPAWTGKPARAGFCEAFTVSRSRFETWSRAIIRITIAALSMSSSSRT
jgi:hypothetical protein